MRVPVSLLNKNTKEKNFVRISCYIVQSYFCSRNCVLHIALILLQYCSSQQHEKYVYSSIYSAVCTFAAEYILHTMHIYYYVYAIYCIYYAIYYILCIYITRYTLLCMLCMYTYIVYILCMYT